MATVPTQDTATKPQEETVEQRFRRLAAAWEADVAYLSSTTARNNHPAYQEITALGPPVVPLLLQDMEQNHTHWFRALREITGANPVPKEDAGDVPRMVQAWLQWARENGHRW